MLASLVMLAVLADGGRGLDEPEVEAVPLVSAEGIPFDADGTLQVESPMWGVQLEAGVPDGVGAVLMANPARWVRVHVGAFSNGAGFGARLGVTFSPLAAWLTVARPIVGIDGGSFFSGDARWIPGLPKDAFVQEALRDVSYVFASAQLGLELGSRYVSFVIRGGASYIDLTLGNPTIEMSGATVTLKGLGIRGIVPSARIALMVCFG